MSDLVFAFDIGTGSLGIAVRKDDEIIEAKSLLLPQEFASTKEQRERRRQFRTRLAHKMREDWLKKQCREAGIEVLEGRKPGNRKKGIEPIKGDPRLEREFAARGDNTVYTSCLLRILLLRGEKLEGWQVYKALHSAIQRRGYDPDVPWKSGRKKNRDTVSDDTSEKTVKEKKEEQENRKRIQVYEDSLSELAGGNDEYLYPCYHDAFHMGLWNPQTDEIRLRQTNQACRARCDTSSQMNNCGAQAFAPRHLVEKELRALLLAASRLYPGLKGKVEYIMYGPAETPYASHNQELRERFGLKEGAETDWKGALGQKIPRFDNRIVDKCSLIPRYNVCRASDILAIQVTFLMKLMNIRYSTARYSEKQLTPEDVRAIFEIKKAKGEKQRKDTPDNIGRIAKQFKFTPTEWRKWLEKNKQAIPVANHEEIEAPKVSGRSRFCRPALRLMKELILKGESPWAFYSRKIEEVKNEDTRKGLVAKDYEFLLAMPDDWSKIHIPAVSLIEGNGGKHIDKEEAIRSLIGAQNSPVIRHRMEVFSRHLFDLERRYGIPDRVAIEFVREDFMSEEAKRDLEKFQRENRKRRDEARAQAEALGGTSSEDVRKLILLKQQNYQCLYTGETLSDADLSILEIDHAVPRHGRYNGSDSIINTVVTKSRTNREKADKTPYEFLLPRGEWGAYCERVKACKTTLRGKKVRLLTAEHPEELDEKYMSLAETAWISRIARDVICLAFGWQPGEKGEKQRVFVIPGGLTAKVRGKYRLDSLLAMGETDPDEIMKKNRADKRHHALDAMVLSYITVTRTELPKHVNRDTFRRWISGVVPEPIAFMKPQLEQTIYAARNLADGSRAAVKRISFADLDIAKKNAKKIVDENIRRQILGALSTNPGKEEWAEFIGTLRQSKNDKSSPVRKIAISFGKLDEYANLSKNDGRGQWRKGAKHQGQFVYFDKKDKARVRPVYAFESIHAVRMELVSQGYEIFDFFMAGCLILIPKSFMFSGRNIPAGIFSLGSLWANGQVKIDNPHPSFNSPVSIAALIDAGFSRVKNP